MYVLTRFQLVLDFLLILHTLIQAIPDCKEDEQVGSVGNCDFGYRLVHFAPKVAGSCNPSEPERINCGLSLISYYSLILF